MARARTAILVAAVALAGCGEKLRTPEDVAHEYLASDDPAKCENADIGFLERETGKKDKAAREACRRNVERSTPPKPVRVRSKKEDGNRAEVVLEAAGQTVRVSLRRLAGKWRVTGFG